MQISCIITRRGNIMTTTTKTENTTPTHEELVKTITELSDSGKTKAQCEGFLAYVHDFSVNDAKTLVQGVLGKGGTDGADWGPVIEFIRANYGSMDKKDILAKMCDIKGAKMSSMNHAYNYIKFAQEYARQEVKASQA